MYSNKKRTRLIVAGLMMGLLLSSMDQTVTATAMPTIISKLGGLSLYSWVFSIYMLTTTVAIPIFGKLADLYGRRIMYLTGMGLFLGGSALCGIAGSMLQLIVFRGIQGLGAGALMPLAMTIIGDIFPPDRRGKMQGLIGAVFGISSIAGPAVGGFITEHLDWHWVFFVNLPLGIIAASILAFSLQEKRGERAPAIDWMGAAVLSLAIVSILLATVLSSGEAPGSYAWNSPRVIGLIASSVVLVALFVWIETKAREPIMPLSLFKNRVITVSCIVGFLSAVGMFGAVTYVPLFAQGVIGVSPSIAGYILTPMMLAIVTSSTVGGLLLTKFRYRSIMLFSMTLVALGLFLMSRMAVDTTRLEITLYMVMVGVGMGPLMPLLTVAVQDSVGFNQRGVATSAVTFFRTIGGALGVSIMGAVMSLNMTRGLETLNKTITGISAEQMTRLANAQSLLDPEIRVQIPPRLLEAIIGVLAESVDRVFVTGLIFVMIGLLSSFLMGNKQLQKRREKEKGLLQPKPGEI